jgi:hypothetical protein
MMPATAAVEPAPGDAASKERPACTIGIRFSPRARYRAIAATPIVIDVAIGIVFAAAGMAASGA